MNLPPSILNTLRRRLHFLQGREYVNDYDKAEISALSQVIAHFEQTQEVGLRIVCAANRQYDEVILGARHFDSFMHDQIQLDGGGDSWRDSEQGFIDNRGNFLTREEAWAVAEAAGQILQRVPGDGQRLYSENLY